MLSLKTIAYALLLTFFCANSYGQQADNHSFSLRVLIDKGQPAEAATVKMVKAGTVLKTIATDVKGIARFNNISPGDYSFSVTYTGYRPAVSRVYHFPGNISADTIRLTAASTALQEVSVVARNPPVQYQQGKVILDVNASVTNAGSTVLEVLERSPGVSVDRNGGITLNGKAGAQVMIDDKLTYLSGAELSNLLNSMSATQVSQIEMIANPTARFDASGNGGIINIKTKKSKTKGFNGSFTASAAQGIYPKTNNSLLLNYRVGKVNTFLNYNINYNENLMTIYALRKYYDAGGALTGQLDQTSFLPQTGFNNTIKTGLDYYVTDKTTIGFSLTGTTIRRNSRNNAQADWISASNAIDSTVLTSNTAHNQFKNGAVNVNLRQKLNDKQDLAFDADYLHYNIKGEQNFKNQLLGANGYEQIYKGIIPTVINIGSAKLDYSLKVNKTDALQLGWKSSFTNTDNLADYQNLIGGAYTPDNSKSNHFIYQEKIHAVYASFDKKINKLSGQLGFRYEHTGYDAHQLGNAIQKDSAFTRNYGELFPSGYLNYEADSLNSFTLTAGRRIDRPPFQNLNPFYFIINKYTYSTGNPFLLPQFSWNLELSHQYKSLLRTAFSYSRIQNYFSQIFLSDPNDATTLLYTQGNVGSTYNFGASATLTFSPATWWQSTTQALYNHKQLKGFNGNTFTTEIDQLNINTSNQFTLGKIYTAELSGFYTTRARNDVQELLYPTGQLSVGLSRPVMGKKGTLRFSARDLFYTNAMEGFTSFPSATEYFLLRRDTRVFTLSFTYRFGKQYKTVKRSGGSAADEMNRVGNG